MKQFERQPVDQLSSLLSGTATGAELLALASDTTQLLTEFLQRPGFISHSDRVRDLLSARLMQLPDAYRSMEGKDRLLLAYAFCPRWMWSRPGWILPLGFDACRFNSESIPDPSVSDDTAGVFDETIDSFISDNELSDHESEVLKAVSTLVFHACQFRTPNGVWHSWEFLCDRILPPELTDNRPLGEWLSLFREGWSSQLKDGTTSVDATIYMPTLATPMSRYSDIRLQNTIKDILGAIVRERVALSEIHWRSLEELLAELLHDSGFQVELTPRSRDGGRDIIARGEFIPGEPMVMAVEAKQMTAVPISAVRSALWANRHFPALMLATSGRFAAGVYREKAERENVLRLYLRDGVAMQQWISEYARRHGLERS